MIERGEEVEEEDIKDNTRNSEKPQQVCSFNDFVTVEKIFIIDSPFFRGGSNTFATIPPSTMPTSFQDCSKVNR